MSNIDPILRAQLVASVVQAGNAVMSKSASATEDQAELLEAVWPSEEEGLSKKAALAKILAAGELVSEEG